MLNPRRALILGCVLLAAAIASGIATATTARWHNLRSVRVTVSNPSLPPPSGKAHTTTFTPGHGLHRAQHALNVNDIRRLSKPRPSMGCTGGYDATLRIVRHDGTTVTMSGYRCGGKTYGRIGGNLPGVLKAVGISPP
jgi:hypothetical protein